jgi:hypothetical protein
MLILPMEGCMTIFWRWILEKLLDQLGKALRASLATAEADQPIAWGKQVAPEFRRKVVAIAHRLGLDPSTLMAVIAFETGRRFHPATLNRRSGATGLIQFMPKTAEALGTTTRALAAMTAIRQLDFVEKYLRPYAGKMTDLPSAYMAVLWPAAVRKPLGHVLFAAPTAAYEQNSGLDADKDGKVTKAEAAARVQRLLVEGMRPENYG